MTEIRIPIPARDERRPLYVYRALYRLRCLPDHEWQRVYLESLRYKWGGYQHATRVMSRLAAFAQRYLGGLADLMSATGRWNRR